MTWSPDGEWLAFQLALGGGMNSQVYVVRPDGHGFRKTKNRIAWSVAIVRRFDEHLNPAARAE